MLDFGRNRVPGGMSRAAARIAGVLTVSALLVMAMPLTAAATHHGEEVVDQVVFRVKYVQSPVAGTRGQIVAHMAMDDGEAIVGETVEFSRAVDFLGSRTIALGSATTDANGDARLTIEPSSQALTVVATFAGDEHYLATQQTIDVAPSAPAPADGTASDAPSLAPISGLMPQLLIFVALGVWVFLFGIAAATTLAIRRARSMDHIAETEE
jgi:hypothetical protein